MCVWPQPNSAKRKCVVEQSEEHDRAPHLPRKIEALALEPQEQPHRRRRDGEPQPHVGQRLHVAHRDADEEERAAPDQREDVRGSASRCGS